MPLPGFTPLDSSYPAFQSHSSLLRSQGHYLQRSLGYLASHHTLQALNAKIHTKGLHLLPTTPTPGQRILLIPNHRSLLDAVILHQVLTVSGFPQPRVVALDFLASTPVAPWFAKCGAIFIKGDWSDPEYRSQMNTLFQEITDKGEWLEFYLEGARSSSGKQLLPKRGLLSALSSTTPCLIYPINLSYSRVIEDRQFAVPTKGFHLQATVTSLLHRGEGIGDVYLTVGEPILSRPDADLPLALADRITKSIMRLNVIHPVDLVACLLLDSVATPVSFSALETDVQWLTKAVSARGVMVAEMGLAKVLKAMKHCLSHKKGIVAIKDKRLVIYYRNRMLYTLFDLAQAPLVLSKEALWTPVLAPLKEDVGRLSVISRRAVEPTVALYNQLLDKMNAGGELSVKGWRGLLMEDPHYCYETVSNFVEVMKEEGVLGVVEGDRDRLVRLG